MSKEETEIKDDSQVYIDTMEAQKVIIEQQEEIIERYKQYAEIRADKGWQKKNKETKAFVKVFKKKTMKLIRSAILTCAEKSLLFSVIPYTGYRTNILTDEDDIQMHIEQIAELCEMDRSYTARVLASLEKKGLLERIKNGQRIYIKMNKNYFKCG